MTLLPENFMVFHSFGVHENCRSLEKGYHFHCVGDTMHSLTKPV
jgi:hypothetical protein